MVQGRFRFSLDEFLTNIFIAILCPGSPGGCYIHRHAH